MWLFCVPLIVSARGVEKKNLKQNPGPLKHLCLRNFRDIVSLNAGEGLLVMHGAFDSFVMLHFFLLIARVLTVTALRFCTRGLQAVFTYHLCS